MERVNLVRVFFQYDKYRQQILCWAVALILSQAFVQTAHASDTPRATPGSQIEQLRKSSVTNINELELQALVMGMADEYVSVISEIVYLELRPKAETSNERVLAQSFMRNSFGAAAEIAAGPNPDVSLLDMMILVSLQRHVFEKHWLPQVWGIARGQEALNRLTALERDTWERSNVILSAEQQNVLQHLVGVWISNNPDRLVVELTRFDEFANARHMPKLTDRQEATGLLSDVADAVTAIDEALLFGERAMWYAGRLSYILGEQTELTAYRLMAAPEVQQALESLKSFEGLAGVLGNAADKFPATLQSERDQLFAQLRSERKETIEQMDVVFRATLERSLSSLVDEVKKERQEVINHFFGRLAREREDIFKSIEASSDKVQTIIPPAHELLKTSVELARLTNETTATIERLTSKFSGSNDSLSGASSSSESLADALKLATASHDLLVKLQTVLELPQLERNLSMASTLSSSLIDRIFLYVFGLIGLVFIGFGLLRFVPRHGPSKS